MASFMNQLQKKLAVVAVLGMLAPQAAFAKGGMSHSHAHSSSAPRQMSQPVQKMQNNKIQSVKMQSSKLSNGSFAQKFTQKSSKTASTPLSLFSQTSSKKQLGSQKQTQLASNGNGGILNGNGNKSQTGNGIGNTGNTSNTGNANGNTTTTTGTGTKGTGTTGTGTTKGTGTTGTGTTTGGTANGNGNGNTSSTGNGTGNVGNTSNTGNNNGNTTTNNTTINQGGGGGLGGGLGGLLGGFGGGGFGGGGGGDAGFADAPAPVMAPAMAQATGMADLVVEDVRMVQPATLVAGPAYSVTFRNQGTAAAGPFRVGMYAALEGKVADGAQATIDVAGMAVGQSRQVTLRLPLAAMQIVSVSTDQPAAFDKLMVAVDTDNSIEETDKANNVVVVDRDAR